MKFGKKNHEKEKRKRTLSNQGKKKGKKMT